MNLSSSFFSLSARSVWFLFSDRQPVQPVCPNPGIHPEGSTGRPDLQLQLGRRHPLQRQVVQGQARVLPIHAHRKSGHQNVSSQKHEN